MQIRNASNQTVTLRFYHTGDVVKLITVGDGEKSVGSGQTLTWAPASSESATEFKVTLSIPWSSTPSQGQTTAGVSDQYLLEKSPVGKADRIVVNHVSNKMVDQTPRRRRAEAASGRAQAASGRAQAAHAPGHTAPPPDARQPRLRCERGPKAHAGGGL